MLLTARPVRNHSNDIYHLADNIFLYCYGALLVVSGTYFMERANGDGCVPRPDPMGAR